MADHSKILSYISECSDPEKLESLMRNAKREKADDVFNAAFRRFVGLVPHAQAGTVEYDFWQTINAFEQILKEERGKTTRLSRTRQKVDRVGVIQTLHDWALDNKETDGFRMLLERNMPELTGEAIVLRHAEHFEAEVAVAARGRLVKAGVDIDKLPKTV